MAFRNFEQFGFTFKTGTENALWRFNSLFAYGNNLDEKGDSISIDRKSMGFGINFGREYLKPLTEKISTRIGAELSFNYRYVYNKRDENIEHYYYMFNEIKTFRPGINLILGLNYMINDQFVIGAEILPYVDYTFGTSIEKRDYHYGSSVEYENDISGFGFGISNSSALISLAYRF